MNKAKAIIYCRTATAKQFGHNTLEFQKKQCLNFAQKKGYEVVSEISEVGSGVNNLRKGLIDLFHKCKTDKINRVISFDLFRISRNFGDYLGINEELRKLGVQLEFVNQFDTPEAKLMYSVQEIFCEYEKRKIGERLKRGKLLAKRSREVNSIK